MLDFSDASIEQIVVHKIGNKYQEEDLFISSKNLDLKDEIMYDLLAKFFLSSFKGEEFHEFHHPTDVGLNEIYHYSKDVFRKSASFYLQSVNIAKHLYECTQHPNIKAGELYVVYFSDCKVGEDYVDAIGLFKSENKETYLKVYESNDSIDLDYTAGVNINKLDKGCLIFNSDEDQGYRVSVVDKVKGVDDVAKYWKTHFLGLQPREDQFYHTKTYMDLCKNFVGDVFNEENEVAKSDQLLMLDRSLNYFQKHENFDVREFENEVMESEEVIDAFRDYKEEFVEKNDVTTFDEFDISKNAIKTQKRFFKSVLKLDKKFHVYVHGGHNDMERGFDEEKGMKYYKLFFEKES